MAANKIILSKLEEYNCKTAQESEMALKEITQELTLLSLSRSGFFTKAAFQGGTCLRIVHGLARFSEDLDFILKAPNPTLTLERELSAVKDDLVQYGYDLQVEDGSSAESAVKAAFLKDNSLTKILSIKNTGGQFSLLKIKLEVDSNPSEGSVFETKTQLWPFAFPIVVQDVPSLFSGKLHAVLCRKYAKGRDIFDLLWYLRKDVKPNLVFLKNALKQLGPWSSENPDVTQEWVMKQLLAKVAALDFEVVRADLRRFLRAQDQMAATTMNKDVVTDALSRYTERTSVPQEIAAEALRAPPGRAHAAKLGKCRKCGRFLRGKRRVDYGSCSFCAPKYGVTEQKS